jgi:hypothetical protein
MPSLSAYADFLKSLDHVRRLHDFTIHAYSDFHVNGVKRLRDKNNREEKVTLDTASGVRSYPLRIIALHARDVYPNLLRSVLLVRIVAAYELFLIDSIAEVSERTASPFKTKSVFEMPQNQLLTLVQEGRLLSHIVERAQRRLSSGGFKEIEKYYNRHFQISVASTTNRLREIEEIHERRHLHVHSDGFADKQYVDKHSSAVGLVGKRIPVDAKYLNRALFILNDSALHVRKELVQRYLPSQEWSRTFGKLAPMNRRDRLFHIEFVPKESQRCGDYCDLKSKVPGGGTLDEIAVWVSNNGYAVKQVIGGEAEMVNRYIRSLYKESKNAAICSFKCSKVLLGKNEF